MPYEAPTTAREKALAVNLDPARYGTLAEIGAGQEVARWFFRVGGAAGTVSKSMSAYDMKVSDEIYGRAERYVSRDRLEAMLDHEHRLNLERLSADRGSDTAFFAFANTVAAQSYRGNRECHAWMGIRFQAAPGAEDSQIVLHVRLLDPTNAQQQEALGIVGVNLVYGAFFLADDPARLVESLLDDLSTDRIEIDLIDFSGGAFAEVDNRVMAMALVRLGLTPATMFSPSGRVHQASEVLYKRPVLVQRGRFRPPTLVHQDIQRNALREFGARPGVELAQIVSVVEMTLQDLQVDGEIDAADYIDRVDVLAAGNFTVLISNYYEYFRLAGYLARYTSEPIALALGVDNVQRVFDPRYYEDLEGGALEALGRLFKRRVQLYVYPKLDPESGAVVEAGTLRMPAGLDAIYRYLADAGQITGVEAYDKSHLDIQSNDVLERIRAGDPAWESMVPEAVAETIKKRRLLGYAG